MLSQVSHFQIGNYNISITNWPGFYLVIQNDSIHVFGELMAAQNVQFAF